MLELLLIRHGETLWNAGKIFRGRADIPLNETGKRQAVLLGEYLKDETIDAVYTSPLSRAEETAARIAGPHQMKAVAVSDLTDMDFGEWQGKELDEISQKYKDLYRDWLNIPEQAAIPGGESFARITGRITRFMEEVKARHGNGKIVIVTHRVIVKLAICLLLEISNNRFWNFQVDTGSITRFRITGAKAVLMTANETSPGKTLIANREDF